MIRGLYTAAAGMLSNLVKHETIVQNLTNVRTIGYKADTALVTDFPSMLLTEIQGDQQGPEVGDAVTGVSLANVITDFSEGPIELTDSPFDFAIANNGFFRLETPNGERYTRDGRFLRDVDGHLVTADGYLVLGEGGPITLPSTAGELSVTSQGTIYLDDAYVGQFSLARFENTDQLIKESQTVFASREEQPQQIAVQEIKIFQGYLEGSNVNVAHATTEMMSVLRAYEANQRMVQYQDQINSQAVSELGRI
jgi:flagellar basal-body rod protein FlgF